jgi:hypothetical protein
VTSPVTLAISKMWPKTGLTFLSRLPTGPSSQGVGKVLKETLDWAARRQ